MNLAFHAITYNDKYRLATLHNYGCTFRCAICSYKLRSGADGTPGFSYPKPTRMLSVPEMKAALRSVPLDKVYFMGGEPTVAKELQEMLDFAKKDLGARTFLGHTNGSRLPLPNLDGANVGLKAWDEAVHLRYTGRPMKPIFDNFAAAVKAGLDMRANIVFVPGLVDVDQVEAVAAWLANMSSEIPFHVMGYIPVPGQNFVRPSDDQMAEAVRVCRKHLSNVASSHLTPAEAVDITARDDRFKVRTIA
jgi:pyruvate formate lyase activating enzyme